MKKIFYTFIVGLICWSCTYNLPDSQFKKLNTDIIFPSDSGVIDVTKSPYYAVPNDNKDDTEAIQHALNDYPNSNKIIYLPNGVYDVSDTLTWPEGSHGGLYMKRTILQGQNMEKAVLRLMPDAPGFDNSSNPKAVIFTGKAPAQRFRNAVRDLTVDVGSNHSGAVGIKFIANNQGGIRNVKIISQDRQGKYGLDMGYTDQIGPLLVKNLHVVGFDVGIRTFWQTASITFEHIRLENQSIFGLHNYCQKITIRDLHSINSATAIYNQKDCTSSITLIDSILEGHNAYHKPAILNQKKLYLRNVTVNGYFKSVEHDDKGRGNSDIFRDYIKEWLSHGSVQSLFDYPKESLNMPISETPELPWDNLPSWKSPLSYNSYPDDDIDDTVAIQKAIDSGASTVYLPNGVWNISGTIYLRNNVRRFIGCEARLRGNAAIKFVDGNQSIVLLERMDMGPIEVIHASNRTFVISSSIIGPYSNTGSGDLFLEDVCGGPFYFHSQNVWARQLNQETDTQKPDTQSAKIINDGGRLWILGLKTEKPGTIIKTINKGKTEVIGGFIYSTGGDKTDPAFINNESSIALIGLDERYHTNNPIQISVEETRNNETRFLSREDFNGISYVGYNASVTGNGYSAVASNKIESLINQIFERFSSPYKNLR